LRRSASRWLSCVVVPTVIEIDFSEAVSGFQTRSFLWFALDLNGYESALDQDQHLGWRTLRNDFVAR
jgi:hypothetical protein